MTSPQVDTEQINATIRYTMYSVFAVETTLGDADAAASEASSTVAAHGSVVVRGWYDVAGFRADADAMTWWHAESVEELQALYHDLRRTTWGRSLKPVWSQIGLHRPAEFNRSHVPAFLSGEAAGAYLCVYPFVRSYEWYLLSDDERRGMLREHGLAARDYKDVKANTVSSFALGDYEWLLAFEAEELHRIVDLMRELRAVGARRHVREEIPFYTGPRVDLAELIRRQP